MKNIDICSTCGHNLDKTGFNCECYAYGVTDTVNDDGTIRVTACEDYRKSRDFQYLGKHFLPYGSFGPNETFDGIMRKLARDSSLAFWTYPDASEPYSYESFYETASAAGYEKIDKFACVETGRVYVPCLNELFMLLDRPGGRAITI